MTLGSQNPGNPGLELGDTDRVGLFLKVFGGEVMDAYLTNTLAKDKTLIRRIQSGKSAQFPLIAEHTANFHTPGQSLIEENAYDGQVDHRERVVAVDQLLVSHSFIDELEELMNHYDLRAPYARQFGNALARAHDELVFAKVAEATYKKATDYKASGGFDKTPVSASIGVTKANVTAVTVDNMLDAIRNLALGFDKNNVPKEGRCLVLRPEEYYLLMDAGATAGSPVVNSDFAIANAGGLETGRVARVYGFEVYMSNVWGDSVANQATYQVDTNLGTAGRGGAFDNVSTSGMIGIGFSRESVGTVMLRDVTVENEYLVERQGNLLVAKQAIGCDIIRSEACGALVATDFSFAS